MATLGPGATNLLTGVADGAEALGTVSLRLKTAGDFESMPRDALSGDVPIDYSENELIYKLL